MKKTEAERLIAEFVDFLGWEGRPKLQMTQITNHSSNDYLRGLTAEETDKMISDFLGEMHAQGIIAKENGGRAKE